MTSDSHRQVDTEPGADRRPPAAERAAAGAALVRWESGLVVVLIGDAALRRSESSHFLTATDVFFIGLNMGEIAIMALPLTLIVMTGEIDLSVASMLGLSGTLIGVPLRSTAGRSAWRCVAVARRRRCSAAPSTACSSPRLGLPSIAVTIGTLTLFRGIAEIVLGANSVDRVSDVADQDRRRAHSGTPDRLLRRCIFIVLAIIFGVVLHATPFGRSHLRDRTAVRGGAVLRYPGRPHQVLALRRSPASSVRFAGILFIVQDRLGRYDAGTGLELNVVAVVLFGGVSIFGGRGTDARCRARDRHHRLPPVGAHPHERRRAGAEHRHRRACSSSASSSRTAARPCAGSATRPTTAAQVAAPIQVDQSGTVP